MGPPETVTQPLSLCASLKDEPASFSIVSLRHACVYVLTKKNGILSSLPPVLVEKMRHILSNDKDMVLRYLVVTTALVTKAVELSRGAEREHA